MVYVALSRVRTLDGLFLLDFDPSRIQIDLSVQQEMTRLRTSKALVFKTATIPISELTVVSTMQGPYIKMLNTIEMIEDLRMPMF